MSANGANESASAAYLVQAAAAPRIKINLGWRSMCVCRELYGVAAGRQTEWFGICSCYFIVNRELCVRTA